MQILLLFICKLTQLMPRRIPDYPDAYAEWNLVSSFGSIISVVAILVFLYLIYDIFAHGHNISNNPWGIPSYFDKVDLTDSSNIHASHGLEWTLPSPTPHHSYNMLPLQSISPFIFFSLISDYFYLFILFFVSLALIFLPTSLFVSCPHGHKKNRWAPKKESKKNLFLI